MIALLRLIFVLLIVQTIVYVSLSYYSRSVRRGKLEVEWEEGPKTTRKEVFVQEGLEEYDGSLRRNSCQSSRAMGTTRMEMLGFPPVVRDGQITPK